MPADWTAIENAIQAFVARSASLDGAKVIWRDQNGQRPEGVTFASLSITGDLSAGLLDEARHVDNPDGIAGDPLAVPPLIGTELLLQTVAQGEFTLSIDMYSKSATGAGAARALLTKVKNCLSKESELQALDDAGLAIIDRGTVQNLTALLETQYESRANLDVRFRVADGTEEAATYIETAQVTTTYD